MLAASVILVHYQSPDLLGGAVRHLESLAGERPKQIVVVDNSANDKLADHVKARSDYIRAPRNLGFAGGVNLGLRNATEPVVILLNPDARPEPGCLAALVAILRDTPQTGIVAPQLVPLSRDGTAVPSATRRDPSLLTLLAENTILRRLMPSRWLAQNYFLLPDEIDGCASAAMVQGACFAFRSDITERIGIFDEERFFLYWEETDFCRRARDHGIAVLYCPRVRCGHIGGGSTPEPEVARRFFWSGLLGYYRKHEGPVRTGLLRLCLLIGIAAEVALLYILRLTRPGDRTLQIDLAENRRRIGHLLAPRPPERPA